MRQANVQVSVDFSLQSCQVAGNYPWRGTRQNEATKYVTFRKQGYHKTGEHHANNSPWGRYPIGVATAGVSAMPSYLSIFATDWRAQTAPEELHDECESGGRKCTKECTRWVL